MSKILRCKKCGDIIQSTHRHDMVWCKCGAVAIDGGDDYCKVTGNLEDMEFLVVEKKPRPKAIKKTVYITSDLNEQAEKLGINFSLVLREALKKEIRKEIVDGKES